MPGQDGAFGTRIDGSARTKVSLEDESCITQTGSGSFVLVAIVYILSILLPAAYCLRHGCQGPELDAFMPAFFLVPAGAIAAGFSLGNAIQHSKKETGWPVAVIFSVVLVATILFTGWIVYHTALRR
jgi:hypothetical protein